MRHAAHDGIAAFDLDIGTQALQFVGVHEAVFEDGFADRRNTVGDGIDGHELGLHVSRESRVRCRAQADSLQAPRCFQADGIALGGDVAAGIHQLVDDGIEIGGRSLRQTHIAAGGSGSTQVGTGLDAIRHDAVVGTGQALDATDADDVSTGAGNLGAHSHQAVGQIDHFRLARGVFDDRFAFGQYRGHHQVFGTGHGDHVGADACALQAFGLGVHIAGLDGHFGTHRLQALDVLIDRAGANGATAGQRHAGFTAAGDQRAQHKDRGAHGLDQVIRRQRIVHAAAVEHEAGRAIQRHSDAHLRQQAQHGRDVVQVRQVGQVQRLGGQQRGAKDRQRGILGAGDGHFAIERRTAGDDQLIHVARSGFASTHRGSVSSSTAHAARRCRSAP